MPLNTCPHCNNGTVACINSRPAKRPGVMRRRTYECEACGQRFLTEESITVTEGSDEVLTLRARASEFMAEVNALADRHFGAFPSYKDPRLGIRNIADED